MKLQKDLVVLDLETTGIWIDKDRIIEIGMIRCSPDGERKVYEKRINPGIPIPKVVSEITGITQQDVKDAPYFQDVAAEVMTFLADADLAGFNLERFDLPLLSREFADNGMDFQWKNRDVYDAQKIYHLHERRDLTAAYSFYCHKDLTDAHSALADVIATLEVIDSQVKKYGQGNESIEALRDFDYKKMAEFYDPERKLRWWNGELYMMFGKYARRETLRSVAQKDRSYLKWILSQDFNEEVKSLVEDALEGNFPVYDEDSDM